jgi:hypothetical protein
MAGETKTLSLLEAIQAKIKQAVRLNPLVLGLASEGLSKVASRSHLQLGRK